MDRPTGTSRFPHQKQYKEGHENKVKIKKVFFICLKSVTSFMSLGRGNRSKEYGGNLLENKLLKDLAEGYSVSIAQLLLKYQLQRNILVIPKRNLV